MKILNDKTLKVIWALLFAGIIVEYVINGSVFGIKDLGAFLVTHEKHAWAIFVFISLFRSLLLIPSTVIIIAGTIAFNDDPWWVYTISMLGMAFSVVLLSTIASKWKLDEQLAQKYHVGVEKFSRLTSSKAKILMIVIWSFTPVVPTDIICWLKNSLNLSLKELLIGILLGESIIIGLYVFGGIGLFELLSKYVIG